MRKYRIRKQFTFEAAHQLDIAISEDCVNTIHGHSYIVEVFLVADALDSNLMVMDFGFLKPIIETVKSKWDHALFLTRKRVEKNPDLARTNAKLILFDVNPTAEVMADHLLTVFEKGIEREDGYPNGVKVEKIRVHETGTGWAECSNKEE